MQTRRRMHHPRPACHEAPSAFAANAYISATSAMTFAVGLPAPPTPSRDVSSALLRRTMTMAQAQLCATVFIECTRGRACQFPNSPGAAARRHRAACPCHCAPRLRWLSTLSLPALDTGTMATGARGITCTMAGADLDARQQRVALRRAGPPSQHVLQRGCQLVAVQGHDPVVVIACMPHSVSMYSHCAPVTAPYSRAHAWRKGRRNTHMMLTCCGATWQTPWLARLGSAEARHGDIRSWAAVLRVLCQGQNCAPPAPHMQRILCCRCMTL